MKEKIQNFWYYYKVPVIIVIVIAAVGVYLLTQQQTVHNDYDAAIVSPAGCSEEQLTQLQSILEAAGADQDGDGAVTAAVHVYRFALGEAGQDSEAVAGLDADLVGKVSGLFFVDSPEKFEEATNGIGRAADARPVNELPVLSDCGFDDLYMLVRNGADDKYHALLNTLIQTDDSK